MLYGWLLFALLSPCLRFLPATPCVCICREWRREAHLSEGARGRLGDGWEDFLGTLVSLHGLQVGVMPGVCVS